MIFLCVGFMAEWMSLMRPRPTQMVRQVPPVKTIIHVFKTLHVVIVLGRLLFHHRNGCPDHLVEEPAKKTHGVGDIIGPARRKAQELTQNIADPYCVAR